MLAADLIHKTNLVLLTGLLALTANTVDAHNAGADEIVGPLHVLADFQFAVLVFLRHKGIPLSLQDASHDRHVVRHAAIGSGGYTCVAASLFAASSLLDLTMEAMVVSALNSAALAEKFGLRPDQIILSAKVSGVQDLIDVYRALAARCNYPLHLGLTEAGMGAKGVVASSAAMGVVLQEGIGDTIRVSLTPAPGGDRTEEVRVAQQILQSMGIRSFTPQVTACPGCGRTTSTFFQEMAEQIQTYLREQMPTWKGRYIGVEEMKLAVMGCVVNGPGESKHANIGISLPGTFEEPKAPVYVDGRLFTTLKGDRIVAEFITILDEYVDSHYAARETQNEEVAARS